MIFNFLKKNMDDPYDIKFQSNDKFYKIYICYNNIRNLWIVKDLIESFTIDLA
jgi:hypothetical protein